MDELPIRSSDVRGQVTTTHLPARIGLAKICAIEGEVSVQATSPFSRLLKLTRISLLYPAGFLLETEQTLSLLFPSVMSETSKWTRRIGEKIRVDIEAPIEFSAASDEMLDLSNYLYWQERLRDVQRAYDDARPKTLSQLWFNRRNIEGIQAGPVSDQEHLSGTNDKVEGRQSAQTEDLSHIQAGPPTDSGYASAMHGKSQREPNLGVEDRRNRTEEVQSGLSTDEACVSATNEPSDCKQDLNNLESVDIRTIYSDASSLHPRKKEAYISELADDLFSKVRSLMSGVETMESISRVLPELLKAFALRVGYNAPTQMHRDVMCFVYKNRR
jgi:hypothetical protein